MTLFPVVLLASVAWAQPASQTRANGEPSPAVQQQQKQADYARKQHPNSGKPKREQASIRTKDGTKPARAKPGEASLRVPSK